MTTAAMVVGMVPLIFADGAGAVEPLRHRHRDLLRHVDRHAVHAVRHAGDLHVPRPRPSRRTASTEEEPVIPARLPAAHAGGIELTVSHDWRIRSDRRRTFAIISHPDAGKTTLTEKLLLFGGAIQLAGEVRAKANRRQTRSDWMNIERQRGISVVTSVMTFEYGDHVFNLLDTPGHEDFSEDTYRTLTAVDSAVMVIDAARGHRGAHAQAFRGLPPARHPDHHLRQQDGPRIARSLRPARRDREDPGA